jgi:hypothetical protein
MSRFVCIVSLALLVCFTAVSLVAAENDAATKTGTIKSVDAKAKSFVLDLPARPLTFMVNDKSVITLDGKASAFDAAIKTGAKAAVTYTRSGEDRVVSKVDVTSPAAK